MIALVIVFFIFCHFMACIWIILGERDVSDSWINRFELKGESHFTLYVIAYYFIITTFSTVGYGDFSPGNSLERIFVMFLEIFGIIFFSFAISSLTTIIEKLNQYGSELREKLDVLEDVRRNHELGPGLFDLARQSLVYQSKQDHSASINLIQVLPHRIKIEMSAIIMKSRLSYIKFLRTKSKEFLAFVITVLTTFRAQRGYYIFREGDSAKFIYFLLNGRAAYAVEAEKPIIFISIAEGDTFGTSDLIRTQKDQAGRYIRKFSVLAVDDCETLRISMEDLNTINEKFPEIFEELFKGNATKFKKAMLIKKR